MQDKNLMLLQRTSPVLWTVALLHTTAAATHATIFDNGVGDLRKRKEAGGDKQQKPFCEIFCGHCNKKELLLLKKMKGKDLD